MHVHHAVLLRRGDALVARTVVDQQGVAEHLHQRAKRQLTLVAPSAVVLKNPLQERGVDSVVEQRQRGLRQRQPPYQFRLESIHAHQLLSTNANSSAPQKLNCKKTAKGVASPSRNAPYAIALAGDCPLRSAR